MKKKIICLLAIMTASLFPLIANGWDQSGTGTSSGSSAQSGKGNWNSGVVGIRVTFVNADGTRLKIMANGTSYYSNSIDLYGSRSSKNGVERVTSSAQHTLCKKPDGNTSLCSKTDLSIGTYKGWKQGDYSWGNASDYGISFGNFISGNGKTPNASFKNIEKNPNAAKKLFKACFGLSYDEAFKSSEAAACSANKNNLKKAYIIYEPLTSYGGTGKDVTVGTGSELLYKTSQAYSGSKMHCSVLSAMANAVKITKNSCDTKKFSNCNLGLWRLQVTNHTFKVGTQNGCSKNDFKKHTKSNKSGYFVGILVSPLPPSGDEPQCDAGDYTVDAACVGCDDNEKNKDRASYVIQDTTEWDNIFRSDDKNYTCEAATSSQKNNVKNYYKKMSCGKKTIYCREEVKVVFPNANNTPTVQTGRYFTVHSPFRDINKDNQVIGTNAYGEKVAGYDDVIKILNDNKYNHNWGDIKIIKTRECRMKNASNEQSCLKNNINNLKFKQNPNVQLTYRGNSDDKTTADKEYEKALTNLSLDAEGEKEFGSSTRQVTNVSASKYVSEDKQLKSNYVFKDVQTISYKLPGNTFRYVLKDSGIFTNTKTGNDYIDLGIATIPVSPNNSVYTENDGTISLKFMLDKDMHLSKSFIKDNNYLPSCASKTSGGENSNIYKYVTSKGKLSKTAVTGITEANKRSELINSSCSKLYLCSGTKDGITCKKSGVDTCIKNRTVNKIGNTTGTNCYVKSRNESGNDYACKIEAEPDIPDIPDIPVPDCPGCVEPDPGFKIPDPDPDAPSTCIKEINGVCVPATGNGNIIYRTIDLDNPFPGRAGSNRYSGLNWCQYNQKNNKFSCYWNEKNEVVDTYILNNRGVKGDSVYDLTPMYTVELDGQTIRNIRNYNNGTSYDDFNLNCNIKGQECTSRFVDEYATKNCNNFGSCDGE